MGGWQLADQNRTGYGLILYNKTRRLPGFKCYLKLDIKIRVTRASKIPVINSAI